MKPRGQEDRKTQVQMTGRQQVVKSGRHQSKQEEDMKSGGQDVKKTGRHKSR